jgi:hypothetical protein
LSPAEGQPADRVSGSSQRVALGSATARLG